MPLKQISLLQQICNSLHKSNGLYEMMDFVAVRAEQRQIAPFIMRAIFVNVMYFKNLRIFRISTTTTAFFKAQIEYFLSYTIRMFGYFYALILLFTDTRTANLIIRWRMHETSLTYWACSLYSSYMCHRLIITRPAAIFSRRLAEVNHFKNLPANSAFFVNSLSFSVVFPQTFTRAIFNRAQTIRGYKKDFSAHLAGYRVAGLIMLFHEMFSFAGLAFGWCGQAAKQAFHAGHESALVHVNIISQTEALCH